MTMTRMIKIATPINLWITELPLLVAKLESADQVPK